MEPEYNNSDRKVELCSLRNEMESTNTIDTLYDIFNQETHSYYHFTIKNVAKHFDVQELKDKNTLILAAMLNRYKGSIVDITEELDSQGRPHLHGIFRASKHLRMNFKRKFWHIFVGKLKSLEDLLNWSAYIHKEDKDLVREIEETYCFI